MSPIEKVKGKVACFDDNGDIKWARDPREYDRQNIVGHIVPGLTWGDIVKAVPVIFMAGVMWTNFQSTQAQNINTLQKIGDQVERHSRILAHLDNYLSSSTGKQFQDGQPIDNENRRSI